MTDDVEMPPTLTEEDERILDRIWEEYYAKQGPVIQGLCFLSDEQLRHEWAEAQAGRRSHAPESWLQGLERRVRELDAKAQAGSG